MTILAMHKWHSHLTKSKAKHNKTTIKWIGGRESRKAITIITVVFRILNLFRNTEHQKCTGSILGPKNTVMNKV